MEKKHNIVYKITNLVNNKIYVGVHKTDDLEDGYMGSGRVIKQAIEKYGIENFNKEVLFDYPTYNEALVKEKEIVSKEFLEQSNVYNLRRGGNGGFDYINSKLLQNTEANNKARIARISKVSNAWKNKYASSEEFRNKIRDNYRKGLEKARKQNPLGTFKGRHHSEQSKQKISDSKKGKQTTSTLGKHWYTNGQVNILTFKCPNGYHLGRTLK